MGQGVGCDGGADEVPRDWQCIPNLILQSFCYLIDWGHGMNKVEDHCLQIFPLKSVRVASEQT